MKSEDAKVEALAITTELRKRIAARESFEAFCEYRLPADQKMAAHHRLMARRLQDVAEGKCDRLMLQLPPGSAKSTYSSVLFPEWYLGRHPRDAFISASHTAELAERFGRRVRNSFADPTHQILFGNTVSDDSSSAGRWSTSEGGEFYAAGVGGAVTGWRADVASIDDPIRSREDADSDRTRDRAWEWYTNDLLTRLKPGGRIVLTMTRWHEDDLAGRILAREGREWEVVKLPMLAGENDPLGRASGERLWAEWFTPEMIDVAQRDARGWQALYQQEPRPAGGGEFRRNWLQFYDDLNPRELSIVMLVDPAAGKNDHHDYTSIWIIGLGPDDNYYVLDMIRDRLNLTERAETVFRLHRKYKPMQVRYERYGMMADIEYLRQEMNRRTYRFAIKEVGGATSKVDRIRRLIPLFEGGRVWLPRELHYTDTTGRARDLVDEFIEQEYLAFPVGVHDDMLDALARIAEPNLDTPFPRKREQTVPVIPFGVLDPVSGY